MSNTKETRISKDPSGKKLIVSRDFDAPVQDVWDAWTQSELLDKWWAPKPWKAETKSLNFTGGGTWLYTMVGPQGEKHWSKAEFETIAPEQSFTSSDMFCDEEGNVDANLPVMHWHVQFAAQGQSTNVVIELTFDKEEDLDKMVEMGFNEGFTMAHGNLDELLAQ